MYMYYSHHYQISLFTEPVLFEHQFGKMDGKYKQAIKIYILYISYTYIRTFLNTKQCSFTFSSGKACKYIFEHYTITSFHNSVMQT